MKSEYKNCTNCDNRRGMNNSYAECVVNGTYCDISMKYAQQNHCSKVTGLKYWIPRRPFLHRIFNIYPKDE